MYALYLQSWVIFDSLFRETMWTTILTSFSDLHSIRRWEAWWEFRGRGTLTTYNLQNNILTSWQVAAGGCQVKLIKKSVIGLVTDILPGLKSSLHRRHWLVCKHLPSSNRVSLLTDRWDFCVLFLFFVETNMMQHKGGSPPKCFCLAHSNILINKVSNKCTWNISKKEKCIIYTYNGL